MTVRPSRPPAIATLIDREVDQLDKLASEVRLGIRGPVHFDELEGWATAIGRRLRAAFREGRVG